jgi:hypothetical protein
MNDTRQITFQEARSIKRLTAKSPADAPSVTLIIQEEGIMSIRLDLRQARELGLWLQSEGNKLPMEVNIQPTWWGKLRKWLTGAGPG